MKRPDGITIISIYHFFVAGILLLASCFIVIIPFIVAAGVADDPNAGPAVPVVAIVMAVVVLFTLGIAAAYGAIGWGVWKLKPWGRWGAIVLAGLSLLGFPVGTIVGGLTLWYLFQPEARVAFGEDVGPAAK